MLHLALAQGLVDLALDGLDNSGLSVTFCSSTLSSAHNRSTPGSALDGVGSSPLGSAPVGSCFGSVLSGLGSSMLNSALDGLHGSALGVAFEGSTLSSAPDRLTLSSALNGVDSSTHGFALDGLSLDSVLVDLGSSALDDLVDCLAINSLGRSSTISFAPVDSALDSSMLSPVIDGLGGSTLGLALDGIDRLAIDCLGAMRTEASNVQDYSESEDIVFPSGEAPKIRYEFKSKMRSTDGSAAYVQDYIESEGAADTLGFSSGGTCERS
jgi:hypothetical protein